VDVAGQDAVEIEHLDRWPPIELVLTSGVVKPRDEEMPERGVSARDRPSTRSGSSSRTSCLRECRSMQIDYDDEWRRAR
jgi:hypothetical protein